MVNFGRGRLDDLAQQPPIDLDGSTGVGCRVNHRTYSVQGGGDDFVTAPGQFSGHAATERASSPGDQNPQVRTTVRLCSRMYWRRYQGPPPPVPEVPDPFQPPKLWTSGQAPVVAPARRLT